MVSASGPGEEARENMDSIAIRKRLDELIASRGEDYASLSRRLGRNPTYIQQFVKRGVPRRLSETDRRMLAQHFGISERLLGGPDDSQLRKVVARPDLVPRIMSSFHGLVSVPRQAAAPCPTMKAR
jgi:DNA-binding IclR family transcriptional regulator